MAKTRGIYKRGNIFWVRYAGLDGKIIFESTGEEKYKDAEQYLLKQKNDVANHRNPEIRRVSGRHTFKELADEYKKWAERQRCYRHKSSMLKQLVEVFGTLPLHAFTTKRLEQYQSDRLKKGSKRVEVSSGKWEYPPNKPATINNLMRTLKHAFTKAGDWNWIGDETLKQVRKVKLLQENNRRLRYLSKEECHALVNVCSEHLKPIVITAINTGMRKSEILSLKWNQVDLKNGFILLDNQMTKNGHRREIPINETLKATLRDLPSLSSIFTGGYVFIDPATGKQMKNVKRSFSTALRVAKIRDFHFHDLRHTFASQLVMAGIDITTVRELLGHRTLSMTLRYTHLAPSHKVKALEVLDLQLRNEPTIQKLYNTGTASDV